jgi:hypothetical protein
MAWWFEPSRFGAAQLLRRSNSQDLLGQRGKVFLPSIHGYVSHFTSKRKVRMKNTQARTERECSSNLTRDLCCLPLGPVSPARANLSLRIFWKRMGTPVIRLVARAGTASAFAIHVPG